MTFEAFVEAVDAALRERMERPYGLFRGPHVAFFQAAGCITRLREGTRNDVELDVAGEAGGPPVIVPHDEAAVEHVAATIARASS